MVDSLLSVAFMRTPEMESMKVEAAVCDNVNHILGQQLSMVKSRVKRMEITSFEH